MSDSTALRRTKIIATLGPTSRDPEQIRALIEAGTNCFRLNFSHMDPEEAAPLIEAVRDASDRANRSVPILADIQGPKLRIGDMPSGGVHVPDGGRFTLTGRRLGTGDAEWAETQYAELAQDLAPGARILLADGMVELRVESVEAPDVHCRVERGGRIATSKGLNVPGTPLSVETLTEKDRADLQWIARSEIDMVALSFVRRADDLREARALLGEDSRIPVMAKLEVPEVLDRLEELLQESDGVMVARGDLAVEVPFERVPGLQKQILRRAAARGKWAIVATQMLDSMVDHLRPTRAEVSDVANAVTDGADALMLSDETATGAHPATVVDAMGRIAHQAEGLLQPNTPALEPDIQSFAAGAAHAAVGAAERLQARALVVLAGSGLTALAISKWRPAVPILAMSVKPATLRRLNVLRGVTPVALSQRMSMEAQIAAADEALCARGWASPGDVTVVATALPLGEHKQTNTIRFHQIRDSGC
jgi:pyruvate kinase